MKLAYRARSETGPVRSINEDYYAVGGEQSDAPSGSIFVVCDGRGGPNAGEIAAQTAAHRIVSTYYASSASDRARALSEAFQSANRRIHQQWGKSSTRVTGVAAVVMAGQLIIASAGDCRAYHFHAGRLRRITVDHTIQEELIRQGLLSPTAAQHGSSFMRRLRALGASSDLEVDVFREVLSRDDALLLCTDGLHGYLEDREIEETLATTPREEAVNRFVDLIYARGGGDNITALLIWREE
jgi:serine/threonine protein phosphatase PrpC